MKHGNYSLTAGGYRLHSREKAQPGSDAENEYPSGDQGSLLKHQSTTGKGRRKGEQKSMYRSCLPDVSVSHGLEV